MKLVWPILQRIDPSKCSFFNTVLKYEFGYQIHMLVVCGKCTFSQNVWRWIYSLNRLGTKQRQTNKEVHGSILCDPALCRHLNNLCPRCDYQEHRGWYPDQGRTTGRLPSLKSIKVSLNNLSKNQDHLVQGKVQYKEKSTNYAIHRLLR